MSRDITTATSDALLEDFQRIGLIVKFAFPGGDVNVWSGVGNLTFESETYTGVGDLGEVELPEESDDGSAKGATFALSGIPSSTVALALTENYQNRLCHMWLAEFDASWALIADPIKLFKGRMDYMSISDDGKTSRITLTAERMNYDNRPSFGRYDDQDQQRRFSGDTGMRFIAGLADKIIPWGVPQSAYGGATGAGAQTPVTSPRQRRNDYLRGR